MITIAVPIMKTLKTPLYVAEGALEYTIDITKFLINSKLMATI